jgi:arylsulfatase A-like enzyme
LIRPDFGDSLMDYKKKHFEAGSDVSPGLSRREFLGAVGAAAGILAAETAAAQNSFPLYQDSFGNIAPAAGDALNVGVYPPPIYTPVAGSAAGVTPGYKQPNILMIMVDQLRSPRWLPSGGQAAIDQMLPNIAFLREHSFNFPNYFVAATNCTPCRATLLTGLYSQQTFIFDTQESNQPSLQTGFPTFGAALAQQANYETCWIGKWHVSDPSPSGSGMGANGPSDYGFSAGTLNLPKNSSMGSPSGTSNEGTDGYDSYPYGNGTQNPPVTVTSIETLPWNIVSDGAIANWFINQWMPAAPASKPWYAAVSFINPHDITTFPLSFALAGTTAGNGNFGTPTATSGDYGFQPPPTSGYTYNPSQPDEFVPPLNASLYPLNGQQPASWNVGDNPASQPYGVQSQLQGSPGWGKPSLQTYFQGDINYLYGSVLNTNGWFTFLNYYFWMQSCVDYQIGRVLNSLAASQFAANTVIMFTSDHGDYGGSHWMHTKGGALYDESINVPLFISFPKMRPPYSPSVSSRVRPFVCSSVDIFAFLYTLALGNSGWRNNSADPYTYLSGREAILDAILSTAPVQRRLSPFPNQNGSGYQPYILHTTDEFYSATINNTPLPAHAIAYRTVDTSVQMTVGGVTFYGGAKLGMYSFWPCGGTTPDPTKAQQYEFYNYTQGNVGELGNSALTGPTQLDVLPSSYLSAFNAAAPGELYLQLSQFTSTAAAALSAYVTYVNSANC